MLTYKTSLIPHCEVNGDQEMDLRDFKTYDVEALGYKCTVIGCRRSDREPGAGIAHSLDHGAGGALPFSAITVFLLTIAAARAAE